MIEMFISMYRETESVEVEAKTSSGATKITVKTNGDIVKPESLLNPTAIPQADGAASEKDAKIPLTEAELSVLAEKFSTELPADKLSLAAIQGYLLRFKHDPRHAVDNAASWAEQTLQDMEELQENQS
jgi:hypothetical protein